MTTTDQPIAAPVDPTGLAAWGDLDRAGAAARSMDLREAFAADPARARRFTFDAAHLRVDLSKNLINDSTIAALLELARGVGLRERIDAMIAGQHINTSENRAVLHTALRRTESDDLLVDGQEVVTDVHAELKKIYAYAREVRSGFITGIDGKKMTDVVNIGIGGSDLGPAMVYGALKPYADAGLRAHFVSNVDPADLAETLADLNPATTLFVVASKTFTTLETLTNARMAKTWLLDSLRDSGLIEDSAAERERAVAKHFIAVSTAVERVAAFGINPANAFGFWDWVGGRYSVDSAIGTVLAIVLGPEVFDQFLAGFRAMDEHFITAPFEQNVPVLMGLINTFYVNHLGAHTHAVLPYAQNLARFPAYLQQLTMESNGKSVRWDGSAVVTATGEVFWGEPGTNGQHAFYQLLHQGTEIVPADFIAVASPAYPLRDGEQDVHELLLANFFAQTAALAFGKSADEVRTEGTDESLVSARTFAGNRPTTSIMAPALTPAVVGQLIALYEHITFVEGQVWGINCFDQWGVELGKQLALQIVPAIAGDAGALGLQDSSTQSLIAYYRSHRS